ncbi:hypothetical protein ACHFJ0_11140 [Paracoccus sp. NGMCC 1.201697]|uniref:Uncharacterized protein n=1 Tax=Paracoccus broussonetiae subsp. drimophilus TaxID=3373869 RepID=A0ABW7LM80_9RHOB
MNVRWRTKLHAKSMASGENCIFGLVFFFRDQVKVEELAVMIGQPADAEDPAAMFHGEVGIFAGEAGDPAPLVHHVPDDPVLDHFDLDLAAINDRDL